MRTDETPITYWAYATILEATHAHTYTKGEGGERWTGVKNA